MSVIIVAPATAYGVAAIALIRMSGKGCIAIVDSIFQGKKTLSEKKGYEIAYGELKDPKTSKVIDQVLVSIFREPFSFTGEESLEISVHGSPYIVDNLISILCSLGAVPANPGEFSMRAYLNGKIDLTQAEAIHDLVSARTESAHEQALARLSGKLSSKIYFFHDKLTDLLALLETAIDHAEEEYFSENFREQASYILTNLLLMVNTLLSGMSIGKMARDGVRVAIVGLPNVGKSSLMNTLTNEDRVIVSEIAGTTRDVIEHSIVYKGLLIRFFDTAGIRETDDPIEKAGVLRSFDAIEKSDLVLHVFDLSEEISFDNIICSGKPIIKIYNKCDLGTSQGCTEGIMTSTPNLVGIEDIKEQILDFYFSQGIGLDHDVFLANIRQEQLLIDVQKNLKVAEEAIANIESEELVATHLYKARVSLEEIVGKTSNDLILDKVFSQFCIGK